MWTYGHLPLNNAQQKIALTLLMASYNFVYDTHLIVGKANKYAQRFLSLLNLSTTLLKKDVARK